jgi:hypothetical protein
MLIPLPKPFDSSIAATNDWTYGPIVIFAAGRFAVPPLRCRPRPGGRGQSNHREEIQDSAIAITWFNKENRIDL